MKLNENLFRENYFYEKEAIRHFGIDSQIKKAIEEMAELTVVLSKLINGEFKTTDEIVTEIADVSIMIDQLHYYFGPEVSEEKFRKLARLKKLIEKGKKKKGRKKQGEMKK